MAIRLDKAGDGAISGLDLFFEARVVLHALFDPVAPVAMVVVILKLVVDGFANQLAGWLGLLCGNPARSPG